MISGSSDVRDKKEAQGARRVNRNQCVAEGRKWEYGGIGDGRIGDFSRTWQ